MNRKKKLRVSKWKAKVTRRPHGCSNLAAPLSTRHLQRGRAATEALRSRVHGRLLFLPTPPRREEADGRELGRPRTQPRRFPTPHSTTTHSAGAAAVQSRAPPVSSSSSPTRHAHSYNDSLRSRKPFASYTTRNRPETDAAPLAYQAFKIRSSTGTRQRGVQGSFLAGD